MTGVGQARHEQVLHQIKLRLHSYSTPTPTKAYGLLTYLFLFSLSCRTPSASLSMSTMSIVAPKGSDTLTSTPISDRYLSHPHRDSVRPDPTVAASSSSSSPSSPSSARSSFLPARAPLSRPSSASSSSSSHTSLAQNTTIKSKDPQQNRLPSMTISPSGDIPHQPRSRRAEWIVDLERAKLGEEAWGGKERVILVLGREWAQF